MKEHYLQDFARIVKETVAYKKELGQTGEGLQSDQINFDSDSSLANKWREF